MIPETSHLKLSTQNLLLLNFFSKKILKFWQWRHELFATDNKLFCMSADA